MMHKSSITAYAMAMLMLLSTNTASFAQPDTSTPVLRPPITKSKSKTKKSQSPISSRTTFSTPDEVLSGNPIKLTVTKADLSSELPTLSNPLTLDQCVKIGIKNNLDYLASENTWSSSKYLARAALAEFGPRVSLSTMYAESSISQMLFFMQRDISPSPMQPIVGGNSFHVLFSGYQPLFTGGRLLGNYRAARSIEKQSLADFRADRLQAALKVKEAYWKAAWGLAKLQVSEDYVKYRAWSVDLMKSLYKEGKIPKADLLREEAELSKAKIKVNENFRDYNVALLYLKVAMGANVGSTLTLKDRLAFKSIANNFNYYLNQAQFGRPEIMKAAQLVKEMKGKYMIARSKYMPQIGTYGIASSATGRTPNINGNRNGQWGGMISVVGGITLFDSGKRLNELRAAKAEIRAAQINQKNVHLNVAKEVSEAWINLDLSRRNVDLAKAEVKSAKEDERLFFRRYKVGKAIELDYFVSGVKYFDARLRLLEAIYDYRIAESELVFASGKI